jgi:hypothetical protein
MELAPEPPHIEGPTWRKTAAGKWWLPENTLGWDIINWLAEHVGSPDDATAPFLPTLEQARFLLWLYAVDHHGKWLYRNAVLRRAKGTGKSPLSAAIGLAELCGPVKFDCWAADGPVGKPHPAAWVQLVGVSQEQTKNVMTALNIMATKNFRKKYRLEVNKTCVYSGIGGRLETVTSSPWTMEGNRPTMVLEDEVQWWTEGNGGHDMRSVIDGNVTKVPGARRLSMCNAHVPGDDSVAERDYDAYLLVKQGRAVDTGLIYDSLEAPADTPVSEIPSRTADPDGYDAGLEKLRAGLEVARGDAKWLDTDEVIKAILDIRTPISESRRRHLNQINATEDAFVAPTQWDACQTADTKLERGDRITLGFDGSKTGDWTALVACRVDDGHIQLLKAWNPEDYGGEVPTEDVDTVVRSAFNRYQVVAARFDVRMFESYVDAWTRDYRKLMKVNASPGKPLAFDMRGGNVKRFSLDAEAFLEAVVEQQISHDGNRTLRGHMLNSKRYGTNFGTMSIRKASKDSNRKIDAAVCAVLAFGARRDYLTSKTGSRTGKLAIIK